MGATSYCVLSSLVYDATLPDVQEVVLQVSILGFPLVAAAGYLPTLLLTTILILTVI